MERFNSTRLIDRHQFFKESIFLTGGILASGLLTTGANGWADIISKDDPRIETKFIDYPGATGKIRAYMAYPKEKKRYPAVMVIHENKGLVPHIQDVARRMAVEGFLTLAPDALSPLGGTPDDVVKGQNMIGQLDQNSTIKNFVAAVQYLKTHPQSTGKVGCTGFCWGGAMTNHTAVHAPDLLAAVPYYGMQPVLEDVKKIKAALLLHYAGEDERINKGIPQFEEALKKAGIPYTIYIYEGTKHAFNNDTNPERYDKTAADLAWKRTVSFFKEKLKT